MLHMDMVGLGVCRVTIIHLQHNSCCCPYYVHSYRILVGAGGNEKLYPAQSSP